ncbi:MAG: glycosyltransferase, partial [Bacteroidales bacterium]|nr:glycosyltransferase [Bacteroidales bacterium]
TLSQNVGRARIRNLFTQYARYDYLLFLDCDSLIDNPDFLETYLYHIETAQPEVICGGRRYPALCPSRQTRLSWRYGRECESQSAAQRNRQPNRSFMTNNFVIKKSLLQQIPFDERITTYGHEDTLLGFLLAQRHIVIQHIDNETVNNDIETNTHFLTKSETAIQNLRYILDFVENKTQFIESVTLLRYEAQLARHPVRLRLVKMFFRLTKPILKWSFMHGFISLTLFNFYKLGYWLTITKYIKQ